MEIAVIGSQDFIVGFRLAGIRKVHETTSETIQDRIIQILESEDIGILVINMKEMERLPSALRERLEESSSPVVIPVGTEEGDMRDKVRRAIGVDLYKGA
ncbi:MAG TPA: V-type ATP synthase subunit F [Euryarchaeota archaeon]|nr:V-type ATP synthase subunit F [Euryarchaeota archaeon]